MNRLPAHAIPRPRAPRLKTLLRDAGLPDAPISAAEGEAVLSAPRPAPGAAELTAQARRATAAAG